MTAKSYSNDAEIVVGECMNCGHLAELGVWHRKHPARKGHCSHCKLQVHWRTDPYKHLDRLPPALASVS